MDQSRRLETRLQLPKSDYRFIMRQCYRVFSTLFRFCNLTAFRHFSSVSRLLRNYATASRSKETKVKVPLTMFGGSANYASALYLSAAKSNLLDKVETEILDLVEATKRSPTFSQFIKDLSVPGEIRVKAINDIASAAKFSDITKNFLVILAENGRLRHIESISKRFLELTMAHRNEVKAVVTTVIIDPSIYGGLMVEYEQKVLDMSLKTRARQMEWFLRQPINFDIR
ncbi:hypothetical protein NE237_025044 [Protea cynaroides]|uniref:ATP synthase subunit O, mitochondrial n=1 Tax=Protea cynaroides TaxID=273540 RepID=A0A9Q0K1D3_9MAGN|nr:hypothetical protein NE237_025044 [Protea cynaroides]